MTGFDSKRQMAQDKLDDEGDVMKGYYCVICGKFLPADEHGVIVHDEGDVMKGYYCVICGKFLPADFKDYELKDAT